MLFVLGIKMVLQHSCYDYDVPYYLLNANIIFFEIKPHSGYQQVQKKINFRYLHFFIEL